MCFHGLLACWLLTLSRSLFNVFYKRLALDSSNWIKICLNSSARILESCSLMFLGQACRKIIFCSFGMFEFLLKSTLFCFSFKYCWFSCLGVHSNCALSIWASPSKFMHFRPIYRFFKPEKLSQTQEIRETLTKFCLKAYLCLYLCFLCN